MRASCAPAVRVLASSVGTMRVFVVLSPCAGPTATTVTHPGVFAVPAPGNDTGGASNG